MYSDNYNYSVSLIRRRYGGWVIDPNEAVSSVFAAKLRGKKVGEGYMASIIEGQLSHCIFSAEVSVTRISTVGLSQ